jgi:type II secretory pathway pseudopilin PulG
MTSRSPLLRLLVVLVVIFVVAGLVATSLPPAPGN